MSKEGSVRQYKATKIYLSIDSSNIFENRDSFDGRCFQKNVRKAMSTGNKRFQFGRRNVDRVKPPYLIHQH